MFIRSFRKQLFLLLITFTFLLLTSCVWDPCPLLTPVQENGFIDNTERTLPLLLVIYCSFILPNKYEIELSMTCGTKLTKLFFSKAVPVFVFTILPSFIIVLLYRYIEYAGDYKPNIYINIPSNYKAYMVVSILVTVIFFFSLFVFFRVITRNCYLPVFACMFTIIAFSDRCKDIQRGLIDITKSIYDPFISVYFIGNKVPNEIAASHTELQSLQNVWTHNRLLFLGISIVLIVLTYLLLRREKLHKGFGD